MSRSNTSGPFFTVAYQASQHLLLWLLKKNILGQIDGIDICELTLAEKSSDGFLSLTREAMTLIQSLDPRRHRRVCRHLRYIANTELISAGNFDRTWKVCNVDYTKYLTSADPLWNLHTYARLLVHEATHGLLFEKGIRYDKETRERVERLCHLEELRFVRRLDPGDPDARPDCFHAEYYQLYWEGSARAKLAALWHRQREAFQLRKKTYELPLKDAVAYNDQGLSSRREGDLSRAIAYYSHAIHLDPAFALAYSNRGYARQCQGEYEKAIADCDKAIQLNPKLKLAYSNRALAYRRKGDYGHAVADYSRAIDLDPKFTLAYTNRSAAYQYQGDYERAIADYEKALRLNPRSVEAYKHLAQLLATCPQSKFRDGKKAIENAMKACELSEWKNPSTVKILAVAYAEAGDFDNAVKWQKQYLETPSLSLSDAADARGRLASYHTSQLGHSAPPS